MWRSCRLGSILEGFGRHFGSRRSIAVRSRSTYVATLPPKSMLKGSIFFFRLSARSSNTHQRGLIWSAILTTLNFREKTRLQSGDTLFYLLEKTSKSCIFTHGAPPCSEQSCNKAMFSRHPRATRGIASRISPLPPKINVEHCCSGPEPTFQH